MFNLFKFFFIMFCLLLNNCALSTSALLGPIYTGAKTGSIYQTSLSYGTSKILVEYSELIEIEPLP